MAEANQGMAQLRRDLKVGDCICPENRERFATTGPLVRVIEKNELCFLTVRHIFGSLSKPNDEIIRKRLVQTSEPNSLPAGEMNDYVCGEVIASEFNEYVDAALVKIDHDRRPSQYLTIDLPDDELRKAGFCASHAPRFQSSATFDVLGLSEEKIREKGLRVVKFGCSSGLTCGKFLLNENCVTTANYFIKRYQKELEKVQYLNCKKQLLIHSLPGQVFAEDADKGAAVYIADRFDKLHCIGMICRTIDRGSAVVTPIQYILDHLSKQLGLSLELAVFEQATDATEFDPCDTELFQRALLQGEEKDRHVRVNIVGFFAEGKTSLTRRLLNLPLEGICSTDGIDVHIRKCKINGSKWTSYGVDDEDRECLHRLVKVAHSNVERTTGNENKDIISTTENTSYLYSRRQGEQLSRSKSAPQVTVDSSCSTEVSSFSTINLGIVKSSASSISLSSDSIKNKLLLKQFSDQRRKSQRTLSDDELLATLWDFGGQFIYYATHQIFHSRDAIYLLVFNLTRDLESTAEDCDFPERKDKMIKRLMFWVNSINAFVGTEDGLYPKIVLVGTHKDKFEGNVKDKFDEVIDLFIDTKARNHFYETPFALSNTDANDPTIDELRKAIYNIGKMNSSLKRIPARWIPLEMKLLEKRHDNILTFKEVVKLDTLIDYPIREENQIKLFLKYHHAKGTLVYFDEEILKDYVIINPQYLIDAFKCIITSKSFCKWKRHLQPLWKKLIDLAILESELVDGVWEKEEKFRQHKDVLLKFLQRHRILAELQRMDEKTGEFTGLGKYMIPSLLKSDCSADIYKDFIKGKKNTTVKLGLALENTAVLPIVYERITAAVLGKWPPTEFRGQYLVFQNDSFYQLNLQHVGIVSVKEGKGIELAVVNQCPPAEVDKTLCDFFRRFVEMVIDNEFHKLHSDKRGKPYQHYFKCNHFDHYGKGSRRSHNLENVRLQAHVNCPDNDSHSVHISKAMDEWFHEESILAVREEISDREITEKDLSKIAQSLGENWELLGIELGLRSVDIDQIKMGHRDSAITTVIFYMLLEWTKRQSERKLGDLVKAIKNCSAVSVNWDRVRNVLDNF